MFDGNDIEFENYINPSLSGFLKDRHLLKENIKDFWGKLTISISEDSYLNVNYGLVHSAENIKEQGFLIDGDFFTAEGKTTKGLGAVYEKFAQYKDESHRFFRWSIEPELHRKMEPSPCDEKQ
jgi:uncharacterized protein (TIGR04255 family)